jgi:UDPglucose 6-dehydrogenase
VRSDDRGSVPSAGGRKIAVIGAGYVGLPTAAVLAHRGHIVTIAEHDVSRYELLSLGKSTIVEDGLEEILQKGLSSGRLKTVRKAVDAVVDAEFVFLCVETPMAADGSADLTAIVDAVTEIGPHLVRGAIIVNKSTVPLGTVGMVERLVERIDVAVVSNPEFLREGNAVRDSLNPDRIVVGAEDRLVAMRVAQLFGDSDTPVVITDTNTSELIKYASNAFLATKLTFINTMARLCEVVGADVLDLVQGIGHDKRIGFEFLQPGPGWGGSCLPKDTSALLAIARSVDMDLAIVRAAIDGNGAQFDLIVRKIRNAAGGTLEKKSICVFGLAFKANTGDRRNSPAVLVAQRLVDEGAVVRAFDPSIVIVDDHVGGKESDLASLDLFADPYEAAIGSNVLAVLTEWPEFRTLDFTRIRTQMSDASIVDARNLLDPNNLRELGFTYAGIGR